MSIIAIEFSERKMSKMSDSDIIDLMEWIVSRFTDSYEMRKTAVDTIYFIGESALYESVPEGSIYKIVSHKDGSKRLKPLCVQL